MSDQAPLPNGRPTTDSQQPAFPFVRHPDGQFPPNVLAEEARKIKKRREIAQTDPSHVKESLVGLALSGGGIRSASFNLGLLQSFFRSGLLRHVDYLSTVSGGGYIGTWFSSLVHHQGAPKDSSAVLPAKRFDKLQAELADPRAGRQTQRVINLVRNGKYLDRLSRVWSFWCVGFLANNLAILSFVVFMCLAIAYCWRAMDTDFAVFRIYYQFSGQHLNEALRTMLPACLFALLWAAAWALDYRARLRKTAHAPMAWFAGLVGVMAGLTGVVGAGALAVIVILANPLTALFLVPFWLWLNWYMLYQFGFWSDGRPNEGGSPWERIADVLFMLATAALLIGSAVLLAIPSVNFQFGEVKSATTNSESSKHLLFPLAGLLLTALTPFLRPKLLVRSGLNPQNVWEQRIFTIATSALLVGLPLTLIWFFARHDFAKKNGQRCAEFVHSDLVHPYRWIKRLEFDDPKCDAPAGFVWAKVRPIVQRIENDPNLQGISWSSGNDILVEMSQVAKHTDQLVIAAKQRLIDALNNVLEDAEFAKLFLDAAGLKATEAAEFGDSAIFLTYFAHFREAQQLRIKQLMNRVAEARFTFKKGDDDRKKEVKTLNRLLLEGLFRDHLMLQTQIGRPAAIDADQEARAWWLLYSFGALLACGLFVNVNATSMHNFYRERLADTFVCGNGAGRSTSIPLASLDTTSKGWPYHLYSATLNRKPSEPAPSRLEPGHLGQTRTEGFLMSPLYCGSNSKGYKRTADYGCRPLAVADAMSISGAAISPIQVTSPFIVILMVAANARTGQWLPSPDLDLRRCDDAKAEAEAGGLIQLRDWACARLEGAVGPTLLGLMLDNLLAKRDKRRLYFITDGGHHENLGIWPLLDRKCKLIIASDASEDSASGFADLLRVVRRARYERGIRITGFGDGVFEDGDDDAEFVRLLELLRREEHPPARKDASDSVHRSSPMRERLARRHFIRARIEYADRSTGTLIYLKPTLTGDEAADLQAYAAQNHDFPHHPTPDQLYDEDRFESYRQLGEHIGDCLGAELKEKPHDPNFWNGLTLATDPEDDETILRERQVAALRRQAEDEMRVAATGGIRKKKPTARGARRP